MLKDIGNDGADMVAERGRLQEGQEGGRGMIKNKIINGDCIEVLKGIEDRSVNCCVTSPPYWGLRDYGVDGQLGLENTPNEYVDNLVRVFRNS